MNPYIKYARQILSVDKFLDIATRECPNSFICYCEIIIFKDGTIELAVPSHLEVLRRVYGKPYTSLPIEEDPLDYLCKCTDTVVVWYAFQKAYEVSDEQRRVLSILQCAGLIRYHVNAIGMKLEYTMHQEL